VTRPAVLVVAVAGLLALALPGSLEARAPRDGDTFRMAISVGVFQSIDPALYGPESRVLRPACAALMSYPDKPLPAGLVLAPELAQSDPVVSKDRRTYTFTIRKDAASPTARRFWRGTSFIRSSASSTRA
jgi:ABC-type transport system substrate-binding protein